MASPKSFPLGFISSRSCFVKLCMCLGIVIITTTAYLHQTDATNVWRNRIYSLSFGGDRPTPPLEEQLEIEEITAIPNVTNRRYLESTSFKGAEKIPKSILPNDFTSFSEEFWQSIKPTVDCPPHLLQRLGQPGDGGKWICGLTHLKNTSDHCTMYSFGVSGDSTFEADVLQHNRHCRVYAYDPTVDQIGAPLNSPPKDPRVSFYRMGLSDNDGQGDSFGKYQTLKTIMKENGHDWVDFLKVDIEGGEYSSFNRVLQDFDGPLPFGQLLVEFHGITLMETTLSLFKLLQDRGLRFFHYEPNAVYPDCCAEYAFINAYSLHLFMDEGTLSNLKTYTPRYLEATSFKGGAKIPRSILPYDYTSFSHEFWKSIKPTVQCPSNLLQRLGNHGDGGKWICGITYLKNNSDHCTMYSFGVNTDSSFEADVLGQNSNCRVYAYDPSVDRIGAPLQHTPDPRVTFRKIGLGDTDWVHNETGYKLETLKTIMKNNGHDWVDILKVDIERGEYPSLDKALQDFEGPLPFGQLLVEFHDVTETKTTLALLDLLQDRGLRFFNYEPNGGFPDCCAEYAFINAYSLHLFMDEETLSNLTSEATNSMIRSVQSRYSRSIKFESAQKVPRSVLPLNSTLFSLEFWDSIKPGLECPPTLLKRLGNNGGKWVCGLNQLRTSDNCTVYSFGVKDSFFEADLLTENNNCHVYAYDRIEFQIGAPLQRSNSRVTFRKLGLGETDGGDTLTLKTIMNQNGHDWVDLVKIDVEGFEYASLIKVLEDFKGPLPFGQLHVEFHSFPTYISNLVLKVVENLELRGLRLFYSERNKANFRCCGGFSFLNTYSLPVYFDEKNMSNLKLM